MVDFVDEADLIGMEWSIKQELREIQKEIDEVMKRKRDLLKRLDFIEEARKTFR